MTPVSPHRRIVRRIAFYIYLAAFFYIAIYCTLWFSGISTAQEIRPTHSTPSSARGEYLARAGDCVYCHTAKDNTPGRAPYAGGLPLNTPFGAIYSTNITPDPVYGIGKYTLEDFTRALRKGIAKDGHHLYPAMPYPSFSGISDEDAGDLYAYFMHEVKPVHFKPQATKLTFPFNQRWGMVFWNMAFAGREAFRPQQDPTLNRGAYLVLTLGHCSACHTPRGLMYEPEAGPGSRVFMSGGALDNWYAANLTEDKASGLKSWSAADIASFLKTGHGAGATAFGSMKEVVENSTRYLNDEDLSAIAQYLKSLPAGRELSSYRPESAKTELFERPGAGIYASYCARCHQPDGAGTSRAPRLAGSSVVLSTNALSLIRLVLEGGRTARTQSGPIPQAMPGFAASLTDREIAEVLSYIRQSWGNAAPGVAVRDVSTLKETLRKQSP